MAIADHVIVMEKGKILQYGDVSEMIRSPKTSIVSSLFGKNNTFQTSQLPRELEEIISIQNDMKYISIPYSAFSNLPLLSSICPN